MTPAEAQRHKDGARALAGPVYEWQEPGWVLGLSATEVLWILMVFPTPMRVPPSAEARAVLLDALTHLGAPWVPEAPTRDDDPCHGLLYLWTSDACPPEHREDVLGFGRVAVRLQYTALLELMRKRDGAH